MILSKDILDKVYIVYLVESLKGHFSYGTDISMPIILVLTISWKMFLLSHHIQYHIYLLASCCICWLFMYELNIK